MAANGKRRPPRPKFAFEASPVASEAEAAAIAAALERFLRDTAPAPAARDRVPRAWERTSLLESARTRARVTAWGDPEPWGG